MNEYRNDYAEYDGDDGDDYCSPRQKGSVSDIPKMDADHPHGVKLSTSPRISHQPGPGILRRRLFLDILMGSKFAGKPPWVLPSW